MATERQIAANRLNAQRCTGPKTPEGKAAVSRNAVTHGLTSYSGLLPGEKLEDFSDLRARVLAELAPDSAIEIELAERIASLLWRLRRVPAFEAALLAWTNACTAETSPFTPHEPRLITWRDPDRGRSANVTDILALGRALDAFLKEGLGGKLSRYENRAATPVVGVDARPAAHAGAAESARLARYLHGGRSSEKAAALSRGLRSRRKTPQMAKPIPRARSGFWTEQKFFEYACLLVVNSEKTWLPRVLLTVLMVLPRRDRGNRQPVKLLRLALITTLSLPTPESL